MHEHRYDERARPCGPRRPGSTRICRPTPVAAAAAGRTDVLGLPTASSACSGASATPASPRCWRRSARRSTTWSPPAGARWSRTCGPTWRRGWATTSATSGCTTTRLRPPRRRRSTPTRTPSAPTSSSSATATTPARSEGRTTLAHELTHVVQQRSGPVDGTSAPGGIKVSDPSDRFEREAAANAERVMSAPGPGARGLLGSAGGAAAAEGATEEEVQGLFVQRQGEEEDEEPVQGLFVQREGEEEEEEAPAT